MIATETRWKCKSCWHISVTAQLLRGKNPFNEADIISGCPKCKGVEGFYEVCDEPGCTTASRLISSIWMMRFNRSIDITTPPRVGTAPPV